MQLPNLRARACVHERGKFWAVTAQSAVTALRADEKLRARQFYKKNALCSCLSIRIFRPPLIMQKRQYYVTSNSFLLY